MAESNFVRKKKRKRKVRKFFRTFIILLILAAAVCGAWFATDGQLLSQGKNAAKSVAENFHPIEMLKSLKNGHAAAETTAAESTESTEAEMTLAAEPTEVMTTVVPTTEPETTEEAIDPKVQAKVERLLSGLTLEQKVAQLFMVTPEQLIPGIDAVTAAGETTRSAIANMPVGGILYMEKNLLSAEQVKAVTTNTQEYFNEAVGLPALLAVNEEGGAASVINGSENFEVPEVADMSTITDAADARAAGETIGAYLADMGINTNFAPMADVLVNRQNAALASRSFGSDADTVAELSVAEAEGLVSKGVFAGFKYFPGYGATDSNGSKGSAVSGSAVEDLHEIEMVPYAEAIGEDAASLIMVGHVVLSNVVEDDEPASLSADVVTDLLRGDLGYNGVVITDSLSKSSITDHYSAGDAAVRALQAGVDMLLMPEDFNAAYEGVLQAVNSGTLTEERIDESVSRIIMLKLGLMDNSDIEAEETSSASDEAEISDEGQADEGQGDEEVAEVAADGEDDEDQEAVDEEVPGTDEGDPDGNDAEAAETEAETQAATDPVDGGVNGGV